MNFATFIVVAILVLIVFLIVRNMIRNIKTGKSLDGGCCGECSQCGGKCHH